MLVMSCFVFSENAFAQIDQMNESTQIYPDLVSETVATSLLLAELPNLESVMNNQSQNSSAYKLAERKFLMFQHTWENLTTGMLLEEALNSTYGEYAVGTNNAPLDLDEIASTVSVKDEEFDDSVFESLVNFLED